MSMLGRATVVDAPAAATVKAPLWFKALAPMKWAPLAGGPGFGASWQRGARLAEAVPPPPYFGNYGPRFLTAGWNGACVDAGHGEMILALNGGHSARQENDAYAISLLAATPAWRQIVESTPLVDPSSGAALLTRGRVVDPQGQKYSSPMLIPGWALDGPDPGFAFDDRNPNLGRVRRRPRSLHTCSHYHYSGGKVWFPIMNAWDRGTGETSLVKLALDLQSLRHQPELSRWRYGDLGPWQYIGPIREQKGGGQDSFGFGVGALDRSTGKLWYAGQKSQTYWSMETLGSAAGQHAFFSDAPREKDLSSSAGAIANDISVNGKKRTSLFVMMEQGSFRIWILDTSRAGSGAAWSVTEPRNAGSFGWSRSLQKVVPGYPGHTAGYGMVYHAPGKCFLAYNCDQIPDRTTIRVLRMPIRGDGTVDIHGVWLWDEVALGDDGPDQNNPTARGIGGGGGSYTRFNCIDNFGESGDSLLLHLSAYDRPTWVCRLPANSFT